MSINAHPRGKSEEQGEGRQGSARATAGGHTEQGQGRQGSHSTLPLRPRPVYALSTPAALLPALPDVGLRP